MIRPLRLLQGIAAFAVIAGSGWLTYAYWSEPSSIFTAHDAPLTAGHLATAAESAGFRIATAEITGAPAVRPRLGFTAPAYDDTRLRQLRDRFALQDVVGDMNDEWLAQRRLRQWVHESIPNGIAQRNASDVFEILELAAQGATFECTQFAITYVEAALALGWQARRIAVDRDHGASGLESTHHGIAEIWSNAFAKWIAIDPQSNLHFEKEGVPLSAWEIRAEWLRNRGAQVDRIVGLPPKAENRRPAMIWWDREEDETSTFFWLYIDRDAVTAGEPMLILPKDEHNRGKVWYQNDLTSGNGRPHIGYTRNRFVPTSSLNDAYWTVGVVEIRSLRVSAPATLELELDSYLSGEPRFEAALGDESWGPVADNNRVAWPLVQGDNRLRLRTTNYAGVKGPELSLLLHLE